MLLIYTMDYLKIFAIDFVGVLNDMSPYLLLGFLFAGLLKVFLPQKFIDRQLSKPNFKSVLYASLLGVPMPLCSCGVIPTGVSFYKNGAGKGATVSFLISTPQTGVDSILATYALLGLPFAIIRPFVALITGVFGGVLTNKWTRKEGVGQVRKTATCTDGSYCANDSCNTDGSHKASTNTIGSKWRMVFQYAFVDFLQDIAKWLIIGLLLAALVSVLVPDNFFEQFIGNTYLEMLIILLVAVPLYVCATGSIPIVAMLMLKGLSPGAALVFLMAGPATNMATITVLQKSLGTKTLFSYLFAIIVGAVFFGVLLNLYLPASWFGVEATPHMHGFHLIPEWAEWLSSVLLIAFIINAFYQRAKQDTVGIKNSANMKDINVIVNGMNCNHCKNSVEKNVSALPNIESAVVNLSEKQLTISGKNIDLALVQQTIEDLGFEYGGVTNN